MDAWAIAIIVVGIALHFVSKKKPMFLFVVRFGTGLLAGAIWGPAIIYRLLP
jgi:hypothetical protein